MTASPRIPRLIVISGAPGSGKTTLARALAPELGFALISKDTVKEALHESPLAHRTSTELSDAAISVLWAVARECPQAILEANFHPELSRPRLQALPGRKLEIHCICPLEICVTRYAQRAAAPGHHATHAPSHASRWRNTPHRSAHARSSRWIRQALWRLGNCWQESEHTGPTIRRNKCRSPLTISRYPLPYGCG